VSHLLAAAGPHPLATLNALLNALAAVLLVTGWVLVRRGRRNAHRAAMIAAFVVSTLFLVSYLTRYAIEGTHRFAGPPALRPVYLAILFSHVPLAALVPVAALRMFLLAWRGDWQAHRRLGRVTLPVWLYVSVTGVVIYLMLYALPAQA